MKYKKLKKKIYRKKPIEKKHPEKKEEDINPLLPPILTSRFFNLNNSIS